jgi:soluble lytic murein transglycosylase-like protein
MRTTWLSLCLIALFSLLTLDACRQPEESKPPPGLEPIAATSDVEPVPPTGPTADPSSPALELLVTKSMLYAAGIKHGVNPYLVMGLAWHESGWNPNAVSSAGAIGIMQVMPATADADGPALLHREVNLFEPADNIDMGTAILKNNLSHWHGDLAKALVAYYAGGGAVTDWNRLRDDERRYVWSVYRNAVAFRDGRGPV